MRKLVKFKKTNGEEWIVNPIAIVEVFTHFISGETTIRLNADDEDGVPIYIKVVDTLDEVLDKVNGETNG